MKRSIPIVAALAAVFLQGAGLLPAQREAFTLSRLVKRADKAALFRVERVLPLGRGESAVVLTALDPVKGIERFANLRVLRRGDLCFEADLGRLPGGSRILLFARSLPGRPGLYAQLPGGLLPGRPELAEAARALLEAQKRGDLPRVLAAQLAHPDPRVSRDALLSLYRSPAADLSAQAPRIRPVLARLVRAESARPDAFATWAVRLALRLGMKEVVPDLADTYIRSGGTAGYSSFLLEAMKRLDPDAALRRAALAAGRGKRPALAAARMAAALGGPRAPSLLRELARSPFPEVRAAALKGSAEVREERRTRGKEAVAPRPRFRAIFKGARRFK